MLYWLIITAVKTLNSSEVIYLKSVASSFMVYGSTYDLMACVDNIRRSSVSKCLGGQEMLDRKFGVAINAFEHVHRGHFPKNLNIYFLNRNLLLRTLSIAQVSDKGHILRSSWDTREKCVCRQSAKPIRSRGTARVAIAVTNQMNSRLQLARYLKRSPYTKP